MLRVVVCMVIVLLSEAYMPMITLFNNSDMFLCQNISCAEFASHKAVETGQYVVAWQTHHFERDAYIAVYYYRVHSLLSDLPVIHVIFDADGKQDGLNFLLSSLSYLPSHTIFIALQDSAVLFDICNLVYLRTVLQHYPAPVLLHLNQEYPWRGNVVVGSHVNNTPCTVSDLATVYAEYGAVIRNYFHDSLIPPAHYLTLGSIVVDVLERAKVKNGIPKASQRRRWCLFAGRLMYRDVSPYHSDRYAMVQSYQQQESIENQHRQCEFVYNNTGSDGHEWSLEEYAVEMLNTVFVLCPAGNNPETFRHYELGAIPIFITPPSEVNFIKCKSFVAIPLSPVVVWDKYPGPSFTSWDEAFEYIRTVNSEELDLLQYYIYVWYMQHKLEQKHTVAQIIQTALPISTTVETPQNMDSSACSTSNTDEAIQELSVLRELIKNLEARVRLLEKANNSIN